MNKNAQRDFEPFKNAWNTFWKKHKSSKTIKEANIILKIKSKIIEIHDLIQMLHKGK